MNLIRFRQPHYDVNQALVDDLFSSFFKNDYHEDYLKDCENKPATNVLETEKDFRIELLLPGFSKDDVQMNFNKNLLTVKSDNEEGEKKEEYTYAHREFGRFNFEKVFKVPESVDSEHIEAKFENGILLVVLPKKEEALEKAPVDIKIS